MAVNPLGVIVFAPLFAQLWLRLGRRSPNAAVKFVQAFVLLALSLLLMVFPGFQADAGRDRGNMRRGGGLGLAICFTMK
jgi:POT family proton-dependent oligopeptide transporter